jgi:protein involved in polysaccharide export with SLBB domain
MIAGTKMPRKSFFYQLLTFLGMLMISNGVALSAGAAEAAPAAEESTRAAAYQLGAGDKLRITVYKEEDLSGEYEVDSSGNVSMKMIGSVPAAGRTLPELSKAIEAKLLNGYLLDPRVAIDVLNYRPFYVLGEVNQPGSFPYVAGLTVLKAIALAGGYTFRARTSKIELIHANEPDKPILVDPTTLILPGDIIRIKERFF